TARPHRSSGGAGWGRPPGADLNATPRRVYNRGHGKHQEGMEPMDYDFTKPGSYPRSGRETLGGVVFLPRTIDKMRAHLAGTAGRTHVDAEDLEEGRDVPRRDAA